MKEKVVYKIGAFTDFKGQEHKVTVCGVSTMESGEKYLDIGYSIQNPKDKYNEELGKKIAYSKASNEFGTCMVSSRPGLINTVTVDCILNDYLNYIIANPSSFIKGYKEAQAKYEEFHKMRNVINSLPESELEFIKRVAALSEEELANIRKINKYL